nr:ethylbenzene dehydrogenase-related protein [Chthonobacter rhizosphaerae]
MVEGLAPKALPARSDVGTIVLHWLMTVAVLVSLATGLRLSADAPGSWFAAALSAILPQGEIWTPHLISAIAALGCVVAYPIYRHAANLHRRTSLRKAVVLTLPTAPKVRWGAVNALLHWVLFGAILVLTVTGILLYVGQGGVVVQVHYVSALVVMGYIVVHLVGHYMYGGVGQWLRLFRPQPLRIRPGAIAKPLAVASAAGLATAAAAYLLDESVVDRLVIPAVADAPALDGDLSDAVWREAAPVTVHTNQGVNLGGSGTSTVEIRAVRDAERVYFAFRWADPNRSIKRLPLVKAEDGWRLLHEGADVADEDVYYEDKFAVTFSRTAGYGVNGSTHMGPKPLTDGPGALNQRGLHYTTDGTYMDMWQWKASRGGLLGQIDDMWFGPPVAPNPAQAAGTARYSAGYDGDAGSKFYVYNYVDEPPGGYRGPVQVKRLPADWRATMTKIGTFSLDPNENDSPDAQWWMHEAETVPYSPEADAAIPVGTVIPAVLITGTYSGSRADVTGAASWADGHWTLEATRSLATEDDLKDLPIETGLYLWVAVFDRTQTRHTRHLRPVVLDLQ